MPIMHLQLGDILTCREEFDITCLNSPVLPFGFRFSRECVDQLPNALGNQEVVA